MDNFNQAKEAVATLLAENSNIGIVVSENQTLDTLAAALSLHLIFQDSGKNSQIISRKDPTVEHSFLVGIDQLKKQFGGVTKTLTVSFPYHDGDIEKVSYNIEGDKLNVNLFAEEKGISFEEKDIKYMREGSAPQLVFAIGISNQAELAGLADGASKIVNIDNNISNTLFGNAVLVDASYSSLSEVVAKLASALALQVEFDVAQNLLDGIAFATQNFMSPKTSPVAFEMIGVLMQKGAVRKTMQDSRSASDTSLSMLGKQQNQQPKFNGQKVPQPVFNQKFQPKPQFAQGQQPRPAQQMPQQEPQPFTNTMQDPFAVQNQPFGQSPQGKPFEDTVRQQPIQDQFMAQPTQPAPRMSSFEDQSGVNPAPEDIFAPQTDVNMSPNIPTEDEAPSDWFTPKVFKSNKPQQ